jgi:hypothetical protein
VEGLVRRVEETDWNQVRARWESRIGAVWAKLREGGAGEKFKEKVERIGQETKTVPETVKEQQSPTPKRLLELK